MKKYFFKFSLTIEDDYIILVKAMHLQFFVTWIFFPILIWANTETYLLKVPYYFDIPPHYPSEIENSQTELINLNSTHTLLLNHPIGDKYNPKSFLTISTDYNTLESEENVLLVRLDNYYNESFFNDDLLYFKVCWPATYPYSFSLDHAYLERTTILQTNNSSFDLYFVINYKFDAYTYNEKYLDENSVLKFQLGITRLPHPLIPIPIELHDIIMYLGDVLIISIQILVPWLLTVFHFY